MKSKRILYITPAFPVGGLEKLLVMIVNSFLDITEKQIVVSLSNNNVLQPELNRGVSFVALPRKSKFDTDPIFRLREIVKSEQPDTVVCLNFFGFIFYRLAMIGSSLRPDCVIFYQTTLHGSKKEHYLHKIYSSFLKSSDRIIAASENQVNYTINEFRIPREKFTVVYNGVDINRWHLPFEGFDRNIIRKEYGIPANAQVIVIAAAFRPEKNHLGAVRALKILHENFGNKAFLLMVGDGVMRKPVESQVERQGFSEFIKFTGSQKDVRPFYWTSDLFSLCSDRVETFSIAALEAMACGLPCVLTNIGGASEMIMPELNGFLCEPDDASIAEAWNRALATSRSPIDIHGFIADRFNAKNMLKQYQELL